MVEAVLVLLVATLLWLGVIAGIQSWRSFHKHRDLATIRRMWDA